MQISVSLNAPLKEHTVSVQLDLITANALRKYLTGQREAHMNISEIKGLEQLIIQLQHMDLQNLLLHASKRH